MADDDTDPPSSDDDADPPTPPVAPVPTPFLPELEYVMSNILGYQDGSAIHRALLRDSILDLPTLVSLADDDYATLRAPQGDWNGLLTKHS